MQQSVAWGDDRVWGPGCWGLLEALCELLGKVSSSGSQFPALTMRKQQPILVTVGKHCKC